MPSPKKLGMHLEWHGQRIRVVIRVPPSMVAKVGKTKLKETLNTTDPLEAEREKVDVIRRLRASLTGTRTSIVRADLSSEALEWREMVEKEDAGEDVVTASHDGEMPVTIREVLSDRVDEIERKHGHGAGQTFASVALGLQTPLASLVDRWFEERADMSVGYRDDIRRALSLLETWCDEKRIAKTVEAISQRVAGRFIHDSFIAPKKHPKSANKHITCLSSYWKWLIKRYGVTVNPWAGQSVAANVAQRREVPTAQKRPFTDDEVRTLLNGIRLPRELDISIISALSGMRLEEVAGLKVRDCANGCLRVTDAKTPAGLRTIPAHSALAPLIARRTAGKGPDAYLFDDLEEQKPGSKRDRSAPVSQAFTRERRRLGVDERASDAQRQSNIDFHSWRRWFVRKAVEGIERGEKGYTFWTIANVVGHKAEDGTVDGIVLPLGMTMGRYAGAASQEAMRACVEAVKLPPELG
ncbi:tyrosine-type recombinase/integrase [Methylobacterium tarhaniae]|uniref:tyrosine-type recombinase/integrase n=1 Tax=Methylobacterium tarhaniae TaxID=1187852 RepID=UPI003D065CF1